MKRRAFLGVVAASPAVIGFDLSRKPDSDLCAIVWDDGSIVSFDRSKPLDKQFGEKYLEIAKKLIAEKIK